MDPKEDRHLEETLMKAYLLIMKPGIFRACLFAREDLKNMWETIFEEFKILFNRDSLNSNILVGS